MSDREELSEVIDAVTGRWDEPLDEVHDIPHIVNAILASDWLADHDAKTEARVRGEVARAIEAKYLGPDFGRQYDGRESPDAALTNAYDEGLELAARIARGEVEG